MFRFLLILFIFFKVNGVAGQMIPDSLQEFYEEVIYTSRKEGISQLEAKIKKNKKEPWYYWMLAEIYMMSSDYKKSQKLLKKCIKINPRFSAAYASLAYQMYHFDKSDYKLAKSYIDKAIEYEPRDNKLILHRGFILLGLKRYKEAMRDADFMMKDDFADPINRIVLKVNIYQAEGNKKGLVSFLKTNNIAQNGFIFDLDFSLQVGAIYEEINEPKKACGMYRSAAEPYKMMNEKIPDVLLLKLKNCH